MASSQTTRSTRQDGGDDRASDVPPAVRVGRNERSTSPFDRFLDVVLRVTCWAVIFVFLNFMFWPDGPVAKLPLALIAVMLLGGGSAVLRFGIAMAFVFVIGAAIRRFWQTRLAHLYVGSPTYVESTQDDSSEGGRARQA